MAPKAGTKKRSTRKKATKKAPDTGSPVDKYALVTEAQQKEICQTWVDALAKKQTQDEARDTAAKEHGEDNVPTKATLKKWALGFGLEIPGSRSRRSRSTSAGTTAAPSTAGGIPTTPKGLDAAIAAAKAERDQLTAALDKRIAFLEHARSFFD